MNLAADFCGFLRELSQSSGDILLHEPLMDRGEHQEAFKCLVSNFISSAGSYTSEFEKRLATTTSANYVFATNSGTSALHLSLLACQVSPEDLVITQPISFVATVNSIRYVGAYPIFLDVDPTTLSLSPEKLTDFLFNETERNKDGKLIHRSTGRTISACLVVHTFGNPARVDEIKKICAEANIALIEDATESLGSRLNNRQVGLFGNIGTLSFNGNKIITTGGGGAVITDDAELAQRVKHLGTTAKKQTSILSLEHDQVGYNYRLPSINASIGCAQLEKLHDIMKRKKMLYMNYTRYFEHHSVETITPLNGTISNHWLNTISFSSKPERDTFLEITNNKGIQTRPVWSLLSQLPMYADCPAYDLSFSEQIIERLVNLPSSPGLVPKEN